VTVKDPGRGLANVSGTGGKGMSVSLCFHERKRHCITCNINCAVLFWWLCVSCMKQERHKWFQC